MKNRRNKKIVLAILLVIVLGTGLVPHVTQAGIIDYIVGGAIGWIIWAIQLFIGAIAGLIFTIASAFVNFALGLNENVIKQPIVSVGWNITLSFANLGFVLAIIIIAFATILRRETYALKQTLWKLIVAALLVNFSLVIAGAFINVADIVTKQFQERSKMGPIEAATTLAGAFDIQRLTQVGKLEGKREICVWRDQILVKSIMGLCTPEEKGKVQTTWKGGIEQCVCETVDTGKAQEMFQEAVSKESGISRALIVGVSSLFFSIVFTILGALSLFALAIMFLIRFIALGILLVLSPLALLCWILPATQNMWQKWWQEFLRWTFFAPAAMFFIYLAMSSVKKLSVWDPQSDVQQIIDKMVLQPTSFEIIGNMIMLIGFMMGGLYVANKLAIYGAKNAYGAAMGVNKWAGKFPLKLGSMGLKAMRVDKLGQNLQKSRIGFVRNIGAGIMRSTTYRPPSLWSSMKTGSGLFKKKRPTLYTKTEEGEYEEAGELEGRKPGNKE